MPIKRRNLIKNIANTSTLIAAKTWVTPIVIGVTLPHHAQASTTSPLPNKTTTPTVPVQNVCDTDLSSSARMDRYETPINHSIYLNQCNIPANALTSATLDYDVIVEGNFQVENLADYPRSLSLICAAIVKLSGPDGSTILFNQPLETKIVDLESSDGIIENYTPPAGITVNSLKASLSGSIDLLTQGIDPQYFIGNGTVVFSIDCQSSSIIANSSNNEAAIIKTFTTADLTINYGCSI